MVDAEDLWRDKVDKNKPKAIKDLTNKDCDWALETSDYTDMDEGEEDNDADMNNWNDGTEDFEKEMAKLSKIEQLKEILRRLMEFKRKGGEAGIDQKIGEVQLELRKHLRDEVYIEEADNSESEADETEWSG